MFKTWFDLPFTKQGIRILISTSMSSPNSELASNFTNESLFLLDALSWISVSAVWGKVKEECLFFSILSAFLKKAKSSMVFLFYFGLIETTNYSCYFSSIWSISIPSYYSLNILFFLWMARLSAFKNSKPVKYSFSSSTSPFSLLSLSSLSDLFKVYYHFFQTYLLLMFIIYFLLTLFTFSLICLICLFFFLFFGFILLELELYSNNFIAS